VGAARLLRGLVEVVDPNKLTVVVNTGDDDEFYGLHVSPDIDTILYTLGGLAPVRRGWGIAGDTFDARKALDRLYGPGWFRLGDQDLATHIYRTDRLRSGRSLSQCTAEMARSLGVRTTVLPVTDDRLRTFVDTAAGRLAFQEYLVKKRGRPRVRKVSYSGARRARPAPGVLEAIEGADAVVVAPSNPFVSIGPILAVPGVRRVLAAARDRAVAVSPLIAGRAVKGPLASMLRSMGSKPDAAAIARYYAGLVSTLVVAPGDGIEKTRRSWPRSVEHDILIHQKPAAAALARFAVERACGGGAASR